MKPKAAMLVAAIPALLGYGMAAICPVGKHNSGAEVPFRPPAVAFAVAWPVLYALLGWSFYLSLAKPTSACLHAAIVAMLTAWTPLTSCHAGGGGRRRTKEGVWLLLAAVLACSYAMAIDRTTLLLLLPLATWLSFAVLMGAFQAAAAAAPAA